MDTHPDTRTHETQHNTTQQQQRLQQQEAATVATATFGRIPMMTVFKQNLTLLSVFRTMFQGLRNISGEDIPRVSSGLTSPREFAICTMQIPIESSTALCSNK